MVDRLGLGHDVELAALVALEGHVAGGLQPGAWKYMGGLFAASLVLLLVMRWFERRAVTRSDVA